MIARLQDAGATVTINAGGGTVSIATGGQIAMTSGSSGSVFIAGDVFADVHAEGGSASLWPGEDGLTDSLNGER